MLELRTALPIAQVSGIKIRIHWSWLLIFILVSWFLADDYFAETFTGWSTRTRWLAGIVTALLLFVSVLTHELAHALVARRYGVSVQSITLFIFGGVSSLTEELRTPRQEFLVAAAGPITSWVLAMLFGALWAVTRPEDVATVFAYLAWTNLVLGAFNLVPGFPLDGGRVLRSTIWARTNNLVHATRVAAGAGTMVAYALITIGIVNILLFGLVGGLWLILIGLFLQGAADLGYLQVRMRAAMEDVDVATVMRRSPEAVPATTTLEAFVHDRVFTSGDHVYFVVDRGDVEGIVSATDVLRVPRAEWPQTHIRAVMTPTSGAPTVSPSTGLIEAVRLMQEHDAPQLPVMTNGRVVGLLSLRDVFRHIELRTLLEDDEQWQPPRVVAPQPTT